MPTLWAIAARTASKGEDSQANLSLSECLAMIFSTPNRYQYTIDSDDKMTSVSTLWLAFARENGAPELTRDFVIGKELWTFVDGEMTKLLYQELVRNVRERDTEIVIPFRCDSPSVRRDMRLEVKQIGQGSIRFDGVLMSAEPRSYLPILDRRVPRISDYVTICSCCKLALVETVGWLNLEEAVVHLKCLEGDSEPRLQYSLCPECTFKLASFGTNHT